MTTIGSSSTIAMRCVIAIPCAAVMVHRRRAAAKRRRGRQNPGSGVGPRSVAGDALRSHGEVVDPGGEAGWGRLVVVPAQANLAELRGHLGFVIVARAVVELDVVDLLA